MPTEALRLVSFFDLSPEQRARIEAASPGIRIEIHPFGQRPDGTLAAPADEAAMRSALREADVLFCSRLPDWIPAESPRLRWVQFGHAGMERFVDGPLWQSDVLITNATGIQAPMIAEWAIGMILYFAKEMPKILANQRTHTWGKFEPRFKPVMGATLGVIGLGHIGSEVARRGKALGMRVLAARRSVGTRRIHADGVDELFPPAHLHELLAEADYVVVSVPLTKQTRGWIDAKALRAMRPGAIFINVCRGGVVDEAALIEALRSGHLGGAALDVFATEPLPADSPLWDMPNVVISPHQSGAIEGILNACVDLLCENLRRLHAGRPMLNVVDREKGY